MKLPVAGSHISALNTAVPSVNWMGCIWTGMQDGLQHVGLWPRASTVGGSHVQPATGWSAPDPVGVSSAVHQAVRRRHTAGGNLHAQHWFLYATAQHCELTSCSRCPR